MYDINEIENLVDKRGYELIQSYYKKKGDGRRVIIKDEYGYKYDVDFNNLIKTTSSPYFVGSPNPFSLENISLWLKLNKKPFKLYGENTYKKEGEKLSFCCFICKDVFTMSWHGVRSGSSCNLCTSEKVGNYNNLKYLYPNLLLEWSDKNKISPNEIHPHSHVEIIWHCAKCGREWSMLATKRIRGDGCPYRSGKFVSDKNRLTILYPDVANEWHPTKNKDVLPYNVHYSSCKKYWWKCKKCGNEWKSTCNNRTSKNSGCPSCKSSSKGEVLIENILKKNNICYYRGFRFDKCKYKHTLPFDFYIPNKHLCIEYQGQQHYKPIEFFGGEKSFKQLKKRDRAKEKFCKRNNINLMKIPYWEYNNIETIIGGL